MKNRIIMAAVLVVGLTSASFASLTLYEDYNIDNDFTKFKPGIHTNGAPDRTAVAYVTGGVQGWAVTVGSQSSLIAEDFAVNGTDKTWNVARSVANPLQIAMKIGTLTAGAQTGDYDIMRWGMKAAGGTKNNVFAEYHWDASGSFWQIQTKYKADLETVVAASTPGVGQAISAGDLLTLSMDGANATILLNGSQVFTADISGFTNGDLGTGDVGMIVNRQNLRGLGGAITIDEISVQAIPEPSSIALIAAASGGILFIRKRFMI